MHFRGPIHINNVAVYTPGTSKKREVAHTAAHAKRHGHQHLHKKHQEHKHEERAVGDVVTATIGGQVVTWINTYGGPTADAAEINVAAVATSVADSEPAETESSKASTTSSSKSASSTGIITGDFVRSAYYNAADGTADGLVFLAKVGDPSLSGTWDT